MSQRHDRAVRELRRNLAVVLSLRYALLFCAAWAFAWGSAVLALRAATDTAFDAMTWGAMGFAVAIAAAVSLAVRRLPRPAAVYAMLDNQAHCGGLLMAEQETDTSAWQDRVPHTQPPSIRWRSSRQLSLFLIAGLYLTTSFLIPQEYFNTYASSRLDIASQSDQLHEQIRALVEEKILDEKQAAEYEQQLEEIRKQADADDPIKTWEALDHMQEKLAHSAQEEATRDLAQKESLDEAQALAEALAHDAQQPSASLSPELAAAAATYLSEALKELSKESDWLKEALEQAGIDPSEFAEGPLSDEQLANLAAAIGSGRAGKNKGYRKLKDVKLIDAKLLEGLCKNGVGDCESLIAFLCENGNCDALAECLGNRPGKGGVSRGRGDAAMTWQDPTSESGSKFKEQVLPMNDLSDLQQANLVGVSVDSPQLADPSQAGTSQSVALRNAQAGGGSASKQTVLPRHRQAVGRYFERAEQK